MLVPSSSCSASVTSPGSRRAGAVGDDPADAAASICSENGHLPFAVSGHFVGRLAMVVTSVSYCHVGPEGVAEGSGSAGRSDGSVCRRVVNTLARARAEARGSPCRCWPSRETSPCGD